MKNNKMNYLLIPIIIVFLAVGAIFTAQYLNSPVTDISMADVPEENSTEPASLPDSIGEIINNGSRVPFGEVHRQLQEAVMITSLQSEVPETEESDDEPDSDENGDKEATSVAEELGVSEVSYIRYTTTALNIRADATIEGERIGVFSEGAEVHVIGELSNDWVQVEYGDTDAFVHGGYLQETVPAEEPSDEEDPETDDTGEEATSVAEELGVSEVSYIRYTTTALNIRADAHIDAERIGGFAEGAEVHVIGELSNNWVQVEYGDTDAFVHGGYLTATDPQAEPEPDPEPEEDTTVVSNPGAIDVLVNRDYRLPADFTPPNLVEPNVRMSPNANNRLLRSEAASALESMFDGAEGDGVILYAQSGYRSYSTQETLFNNYVDSHGYEAASRFSAKPGHSEHQTGLAMDVTSESVNYRLTQDFGNTPEGQWVAANAHRFGFIIRYPQNKESVTGYIYEPWHLRYLGVDLATAVYESGLTYEEYLGY